MWLIDLNALNEETYFSTQNLWFRHLKISDNFWFNIDCIAMISMYKSEVCNRVYWIIISQLPLTTLVVQALSCKFMLHNLCLYLFYAKYELSCNGISRYVLGPAWSALFSFKIAHIFVNFEIFPLPIMVNYSLDSVQIWI